MSDGTVEGLINRILAIWEREGCSDLNKARQIYNANHSTPLEVIRKSYKKFVVQLHPDKCNLPRAHDAFIAVQKAKEELEKSPPRQQLAPGYRTRQQAPPPQPPARASAPSLRPRRPASASASRPAAASPAASVARQSNGASAKRVAQASPTGGGAPAKKVRPAGSSAPKPAASGDASGSRAPATPQPQKGMEPRRKSPSIFWCIHPNLQISPQKWRRRR